jgi:hypothetical protein
MLHDKSMAIFGVLNNMVYGVMANDKLAVLSNNSPFISLYDFWNGAMHECNYSHISYTVVHDVARHAA